MKIKGIRYTGPIFDSCYDEQTEVLTDSGWKFFKDVVYDDKICTLNSKQIIEYNTPTNIINESYVGEMYHFISNRSKIDLLVTPNHNMYVQTNKGRQNDKIHDLYVKTYGVDKLCNNVWRLETAESVADKTRYFKKDANYIKDDVETIEICERIIYMDDWLEFLGYYLSEGSSTITKRKNYIVQIRQFGDNLYKMAKVLNKISPNKINIKKDDGRVILNDKDLCMYLKITFGNVYTKYIPRDILNICSRKQLNILFEALMLGDGHDLRNNYKNGKISGGSSYHTASLQLKNDFMELLLKIGYSGSSTLVCKKGEKFLIYNRECTAGADNYKILVRFSNNICAKNEKNKFYVNTVNYSGTIHCVTVKNHTLYVRRNGCPVWCGNSGYAKACRGNIMSLHKLGVPLTLNPISFESAKPELGEEGKILNSLINKDIDYNVNFIHTTPEFWEKHRQDDKINVGFTVWETDRLHYSWPNYINNNVDKVLVPCEWNVEVFKNSGVTIPIGVVQHGINMDDFKDVESYSVDGVDKDTFMFYSIFQWTEKKCPLALIKAYWYAFQNNENVALVLKTYRSSYAEVERQAIRTTIQRLKSVMPMKTYPPIYLISHMLSEKEILGLHTRGDCCVSLDRFEGFGLVPFFAGANGKPIIVTGFGGSTEYAKEDNSYLNPYTLTPVFGMPYSPWHSGESLWGEPDVYTAAKTMRHVYKNQDEAKEKGARLKKYISENFTWDHIGKKLIKEIEML